jgi:hypothetical protein
LDCSRATPASFGTGYIEEIFDAESTCVLVSEYSGSNYAGQAYWNGNLDNGKKAATGWYTLKISIYSNGYSETSCMAFFLDNEKSPPPPISGLFVKGSGYKEIYLAWPSSSKAARYRIIYQSGSSIDSTALSVLTTLPTCTLSNIVNGATYTFAVQAGNAGGYSLSSQPITVTLPLVIPKAPENIKSIDGYKSARLFWDSSYCAKSYSIEWAIDWSLWTADQRISTNKTTLEIAGLENNREYQFRIYAENDSGKSGAAFAKCTVGLAQPMLTLSSQDNIVVVAWDSVPFAKSYNLYYDTGSGTSPASAAAQKDVTSPLTITSLRYYLNYRFAVCGFDGITESIIKKWWRICMIPTPGHLTARINNERLVADWDTVQGAMSYVLYLCDSSIFDTSRCNKIRCDTSGINSFSYWANFGKTLTVAVSARNNDAVSTISKPLTIMSLPSSPKVVYFTFCETSVYIDWNEPYTSKMGSYVVYFDRGDTISKNAEKIQVTDRNYSRNDLVARNTYCFKVASKINSFESEFDSVYSFIACSTKNNHVAYDSVGNVTMTWDSIPGVNNYYIAYRDLSSLSVGSPLPPFVNFGSTGKPPWHLSNNQINICELLHCQFYAAAVFGKGSSCASDTADISGINDCHHE